MPITKPTTELVETPITDNDQFQRTGVIRQDSFAVCDNLDKTKQLKFDVTSLAAAKTMTLVAPVSAADLSVTLPATAVDNGALNVTSDTNIELSTVTGSAISVTKLLTNISTAAPATRTLAAPSAAGQIKIINMSVDNGDCTLVCTNIGAGTGTATFASVGDCLILMSAGGKWQLLGGTAVIA